MSLTVASAALDTAWAEFGAVAYTAGTLADEDACVTEVESKLRRGTLGATSTPTDTEVKNWLQMAKQELAEIRQFTWKRRYVTTTLTAGVYRYSLPPDFDGGHINIRDKTNNRKIKVVSSHVFDTLWPDPEEDAGSSGILCACIKNLELWLMPTPGADVIELEYERSGDDITPTDFSWLPEIERFRCCYFTLAESFASLHQWDAMRHYRGLWEKGLAKAIKSDGKRKWSTSGYQARSVFQA